MFGSAIIIYVFLGLFFVLGKTEPISCYDCNSKYDPKCGDPFDNSSIGTIICSDRKIPDHLAHMISDPKEPVLCRKMKQKVEGEIRVIRGCGYIRDDHDDKKCFKRTGTKDVEVIHCSCTKSLCNTGHSMQRPTFRIIMTILITLAIISLLNSFSS